MTDKEIKEKSKKFIQAILNGEIKKDKEPGFDEEPYEENIDEEIKKYEKFTESELFKILLEM
jgi:hypothetical protein